MPCFLPQIAVRFKRMWGAFRSEAMRDDGVAGLIIAIALIALATTMIASLQRQNIESKIQRITTSSTSAKVIKDSILAYFLTGDDATPSTLHYRLPCPDTDMPPDGLENGTTTCAASTGVLPWISLRLSESDAIDAYGNYFTYAVTSNDTARSVCTSVANSYDSSLVEFTGTMNNVTDTEVRLSSQSAGEGTPYYYAIISHGANGLGAISSARTARATPSSSAELQNCPSTNSNCTDPSNVVIISGPANTDSSSYFDDKVYVGSNTQLTRMCETLTPGGEVNAVLNEDFTDATVGALPSNLASLSGSASTQQSTVSGNATDRVLRFSGGGAAIRATTLALSPAERGRYFSFEWTPTTLGTSNTAGISAGLRATPADRNTVTTVGSFSADIFDTGTNDGITVRFFTDVADNANGATANNIFICDNVTTACDSGSNLAISASTFTISNNTSYTVEIYDDGVQVSARITQNNLATNTAFVSLTAIAAAQRDLGNTNGVTIVNYSDATTEVDDMFLGRGGMAARFDGADDIVLTGGDNHDTTTGNLTLEAWMRPRAIPTTGQATLISKWIEGAANTSQAYRLYIRAGGGITLQLAGTPGTGVVLETHNFSGYTAKAGQWDHIAVSYNGTATSGRAAKLYVNRELIASSTSTSFATNGVRNGTARFTVGAERDSVPNIVNEFTGDITDVRAWNVARTASEIFDNYDRRLPLVSGSAPGLIANWTFDRDKSGTLPTFAATTVVSTLSSTAGVNGTLTGATYTSIGQRHVPVFASAAFCSSGSSQGAVVGAFKCEYRQADQSHSISVPNNLSSFHVKAWGAGGGGYEFGSDDSTGGGSGFSAGKLYTISGTAITGRLDLRIDVSTGGAAATARNNGAGGGGASGLWRDTDVDDVLDPSTDFPGMIAGGGGGASFGDDNMGTGSNPNCDTEGNCGPGGGGGGTGAAPARAPDESSSRCGGRPGSSTSFPATSPVHATNCEAGGIAPTDRNGASGSGSAAGGVSLIANGGAGHNGLNDGSGGAADEIGSGGGGGGIRVVGMTSGGGQTGGFDSGTIDTDANVPDDDGSGFGGGGGAGFADTGAIGATGQAGRSGVANGNNANPGGTQDPDYAGTGYCSATGSPCSNTPGRGGESGSTAGKQGAVIIQW